MFIILGKRTSWRRVTFFYHRRPLVSALLLASTIGLLTLALASFEYPDRPAAFNVKNAIQPKLKFSVVEPRPTPKHSFTPDGGLLVVNPDSRAPHPIFQLIREAEDAWEMKRARASKSLDEAIREYRRRYGRAPPRGFDAWWDYVVKHRVQLPDEYDEIYEDIEPYWGLDPAEIQATLENAALFDADSGVATVARTPAGRLEIVQSTIPIEKPNLKQTVENLLALVQDVAHLLPPLRFVMSPQDNPGMMSDWRIVSMAREAAANGTTLDSADIPRTGERGWIQACPPDSPARMSPSPLLQSQSPSSMPSTLFPSSSPHKKTFIASHRASMDPCAHPSLLSTHGQFLSNQIGPFPKRTLVPRFSLCSTMLHHDIRPPVPYGWEWESDLGHYEDEDYWALKGGLPWEQRVDERLGWRGRTTGMYASSDTLWVHGHRARLVSLANALEGNVSVLPVPAHEHDVTVGELETLRLARVNPSWMDVAFTDKPIACNEHAGTCNEMRKMWEFRRIQESHEEGRYKFILDVDGNGWSGRFKRLMTSNALIFKATVYPEWFASRIVPWVHYVPIQVSYADLYDAVAFFRTHDDLAARIAKAGRDWSRRYWRREDMTAYLFRLLLEYGRVTSLDRASMDYKG